mgnify:CR=1 FL=1
MSEAPTRGRRRKATVTKAEDQPKVEPKTLEEAVKESSNKVRLVAAKRPITNLVTKARYSLNVPSEPISLADNSWEKAQVAAGIWKEY